MGPSVILITLGREGSIIYYEGSLFKIPAIETKVVDPTGAGDAYFGGFIFKYMLSKDPLQSAIFATSTASFIVEAIGPKNLPTVKMVNERIKESSISERIRQL